MHLNYQIYNFFLRGEDFDGKKISRIKKNS
jgi:hypothetical protein